tara:strand:- start:353 stop:583 length:231 start_codon:yes stop_codon:yes gene_type:complete
MKHTRVTVALLEAPPIRVALEQVRKERALPSATGLSHAIDGLEHYVDLLPAVSPERRLDTRRGTAVHNFILEQLTL